METLRLERITLKVEILAPLHIGDGTDLEPLEYVIVDGYLYKIDTASFLSSLEPESANELNALLKGNMDRVTLVKIRKFVQEHFKPEGNFIWKSRVTPTIERLYKERLGAPENQVLVYPFIRSGDRPFLPGSSLKGAIRTALLNYWANELWSVKDDRNSRLTEAEILKATFTSKDNRLKPSIEKDPLKALRVEDVFLPEDSTIFAKVSNWNLSKEGILKETKIQMIRELTLSSVSDAKALELDVYISLDNRFLKHNHSGLGRRDLSIKNILDACNSFYRRVLLDEKKRFFDKTSPEIASIYKKINDEGGTLLRIGWASGFDSMTITKFRNKHQPWGRSKHLAEAKFPMGWVKLSLP